MRTLIRCFEERFQVWHSTSLALLLSTDADILHQRPRELPSNFVMFSVGEYILRSAASVEQTFGGLTTRLWDDPFEWTLPEKLSTPELVIEYLQEVDQTRRRGFEFLSSDEDLLKQLPAPETIMPIASLLLSTIARAEHLQGRAFAVFQMLSNIKLPTK